MGLFFVDRRFFQGFLCFDCSEMLGAKERTPVRMNGHGERTRGGGNDPGTIKLPKCPHTLKMSHLMPQCENIQQVKKTHIYSEFYLGDNSGINVQQKFLICNIGIYLVGQGCIPNLIEVFIT